MANRPYERRSSCAARPWRGGRTPGGVAAPLAGWHRATSAAQGGTDRGIGSGSRMRSITLKDEESGVEFNLAQQFW
jgi:hypothetical protein